MSHGSAIVGEGVLGGGDAPPELSALLEDHGLTGSSCAVAYLSFADPESCIAAYDHDGGLTPLIGFLPLPMRGSALLQAIAAIDENGPRLVENFRRAFPADVAGLGSFEADVDIGETAAPGWLLAACSLALGLEDDDVVRALESSHDVVGLDTFVIEVEGRYFFDSRRLLRSLMSYRIGGASKVLLARSVFTSIGRFVADSITRLLRDWPAVAVVCAGDLFAGNIVLRESVRSGIAHLGPPLIDPHSEVRPSDGPRRAGAVGQWPVPVRLAAGRPAAGS